MPKMHGAEAETIDSNRFRLVDYDPDRSASKNELSYQSNT